MNCELTKPKASRSTAADREQPTATVTDNIFYSHCTSVWVEKFFFLLISMMGIDLFIQAYIQYFNRIYLVFDIIEI